MTQNVLRYGVDLQIIESKIYEIRGQRVMLDFDLAKLYQVETKRLKEQVKRNIERFPEDFMFVLSGFEWKELVAICDRLPAAMKHTSALPFAFTQKGIAMLSGILRSPTAILMNIAIMRAFVAMRQMVFLSPGTETVKLRQEVQELRKYVEETLADQNDINDDTRMQIELLNQVLAELQVRTKEQGDRKRRPIGFIKPEE